MICAPYNVLCFIIAEEYPRNHSQCRLKVYEVSKSCMLSLLCLEQFNYIYYHGNDNALLVALCSLVNKIHLYMID